MPEAHLLRCEADLARAHRAIYAATQELYSDARFDGHYSDLMQLLDELERIQVGFLKGKKLRTRPPS